jgi:hypothetical protein
MKNSNEENWWTRICLGQTSIPAKIGGIFYVFTSIFLASIFITSLTVICLVVIKYIL